MGAQRDDIGERLVRLRGTKRRSRERDVPIVTDWQGTLVGYALEHARGTAADAVQEEARRVPVCRPVRGQARRDRPLHAERSAADLLHLAAGRGAHLDTIAPTMGHADTRMLQRTYARLPPDLLAARLATEMGLDTGWTDQSAPSRGPWLERPATC